MSRKIRVAVGGLYALGILAALTFGATQAFAKRPSPCTAFFPQIACSSVPDCDVYCRELGGDSGGCDRPSGCCWCAM